MMCSLTVPGHRGLSVAGHGPKGSWTLGVDLCAPETLLGSHRTTLDDKHGFVYGASRCLSHVVSGACASHEGVSMRLLVTYSACRGQHATIETG